MVENGPESTVSTLPAPEDRKPGRVRNWILRDWLAAAALFAATAGVVLWQNAHVAVLFDFSYILNTAERIALGQVPYRDFPLAHAPLTFLVQAAIVRLTGRVIFHHVLYTAIIGGLGTVLTWRIVFTLLRGRIAAAWIAALLLAAPLVFLGVYSLVPNPEYDCDCGFWLVVAVWFFLALERRKRTALAFASGVFACVPMFFKQNMGLPFLLTAVAAVLLPAALRRTAHKENRQTTPTARHVAGFIAGACVALVIALLAIQCTAGLGNYYCWTIQYAGRRRLPGLSLMLGVYNDPTLAWTLLCVAAALMLLRTGIGRKPSARVVAFALLASPFIFALSSLVRYDDADQRGDALLALWPLMLVLGVALALTNLFALRRNPSPRLFLPLVLLAAVHGTFLSQQLWGSTYGIWPLLILLIAELLASLAGFIQPAPDSRRFQPSLIPAVAAVIAVTLFICGGFYAASEERLSYAYFPSGPPAHSSFPALAGLATPGPYIPEIDELLRYAQANIPFEDGIVLIPGEEPFYFATGRVPRFPVPFFDPTIDPYSSAEIAAMVRTRDIRWLIVKTDVQTKEDPTPDRAELMRLLLQEFTPAAHLRGYDILRRSGSLAISSVQQSPSAH